MKLLKNIFLKMGNGKSKSKNKNARGGKNKIGQTQQETDGKNYNISDFGADYDPELLRMRRSLEKDQQGFILNNLMLSVQFFENYDK